jgi:hypothetical protein
MIQITGILMETDLSWLLDHNCETSMEFQEFLERNFAVKCQVKNSIKINHLKSHPGIGTAS